jgi:hypothetical protein
MTSLIIEVISFTSIVPTCRLTLLLLARSNVTKGKQPIFPSKVKTPFSNLGRQVTQEYELRDVVPAPTSTIRLISISKQTVPVRFASQKEPLLINENMVKKTLKSWIPMQALLFKHVNTPL